MSWIVDDAGKALKEMITRRSEDAEKLDELLPVGSLQNPILPYNVSEEDLFTVLHFAAKSGNLAAIELIAKKSICINPSTLSGKTALYYAVEQRHHHIVEFYISNLKMKNKMVQLLQAVKLGHLDVEKEMTKVIDKKALSRAEFLDIHKTVMQTQFVTGAQSLTPSLRER